MRVFITSAPEELEPMRRLAVAAIRELGSVPMVRDPGVLADLAPVRACVRQVANADAVLVIVGHRRGDIPPPSDGGDGRHPWAWWETRAAFERHLPVKALLAAADWRPDLREKENDGQAVMSDFRGELAHLGTSFHDEQDFCDLARELIAAADQDDSPLGKDAPAITGLHAPSGTDKSSFLDAGLVAGLRAEGHPVASSLRTSSN